MFYCLTFSFRRVLVLVSLEKYSVDAALQMDVVVQQLVDAAAVVVTSFVVAVLLAISSCFHGHTHTHRTHLFECTVPAAVSTSYWTVCVLCPGTRVCLTVLFCSGILNLEIAFRIFRTLIKLCLFLYPKIALTTDAVYYVQGCANRAFHGSSTLSSFLLSTRVLVLD